MPLLRRQPFIKEPVPEDLDPDEYLFHCKLTDEVFRDYEAFFERIILCNSLLWTCEMTGRPGLTYLEATQNEEKARAALAAMPHPLKRTMLFLACCARRHRLKDLRDDIVNYMRERFFAGEELDAVVNGERKLCEVVKVIAPHALTNGNSLPSSDDSDNDSVELTFDPSEFHYQVRIVGSAMGSTHVVTAADLMRKKSIFTRDKCKLFLKHACNLTNGNYLAKEKFVEKYGLVKMKFCDIFAGAIPRFDDKKRRSAHKLKTATGVAGKHNDSDRSGSKKKKKKKKSSSKDRENKANEEEKHKIEEQRRLKKEEKEKEREKQREERRLVAECLREWQKPRDDLECDDLVDLPTPVAVVTALPNELFGDVLALLEFTQDFSEFLSIKEKFPQGITLDVIESALLDNDVQGSFNDLLQMLLTSVFTVLDNGEGADSSGAAVTDRGHKDDEAATAFTSVAKDDADLRTAVAAANMPMQTHGVSLRNIDCDAFTLTEVLRLHLLSSGLRSGSSGSFMNRDDPSRQFRLDESDLLNSMKSRLVFDLPPGDKLKILMCLVSQLLTCDTLREDVEYNIERLRLARYEFKMFQWAEHRREREEAAQRLKKLEMEEAAAAAAASEGGNAVGKKPAGYISDGELDKQEAKRRNEGAKREREFLEMINKLQGRGVVQPLGSDRAHRRFWMFNATPGLFVEDDDDTVGPCLPRPTPYNPNSNPYVSFNQSVSDARLRQSDKENAAALLEMALHLPLPPNANNVVKAQKLLGDNRTNGLNGLTADGDVVTLRKPTRLSSQDSLHGDKKSGQVFGMCNALGDRCPVHGSTRRRRPRWSFFPSAAHVESLIAALNPRGFREGNLKEMLVAEKKRVLQSVSKCPVARLNQEIAAMVVNEEVVEETTEGRKSSRRLSSSSAGVGGVCSGGDVSVISRVTNEKSNRSEDFMNLKLRDSLLELEEKLYAGGLGSVKVEDRESWRERIASYDPDSIGDEEREAMMETTTELANYLLEIFRGIEAKYIIAPLGSAGGSADSDRGGSRSLASRWQESLASCTSLSQVFVHMATLERSVAWSRSVLNARCRICRRKGDAEHMLLCDECDRGHHMYCLKPPLTEIPEGDWMCGDCCPKPKMVSKKRRVQFVEKVVSEDDDDDDEQSDVNVDDVEDQLVAATSITTSKAGGRFQKKLKQEQVCNACHKNGPLISCIDCQVAYHSACTLPPLKKMPRGKWTCSECAERSAASTSVVLTGRAQSKKRNSSAPAKHTKTEVILSSPEPPRRSERMVKRVLDYSKHSRESSEDEESFTLATSKRPKRNPHIPTNDVPDDEWYGLVRRSMPSVNRRGASDDVPLDFRVCDRLLTDLVRHEQGWPFLRPVTRKEVPAYYEVVKRPVDFGMIRSRLNGMHYQSNKAFVCDVLLVFQNCCVINPVTGPEYQAAEILGRFFLRRVRESGLGLLADQQEADTKVVLDEHRPQDHYDVDVEDDKDVEDKDVEGDMEEEEEDSEEEDDDSEEEEEEEEDLEERNGFEEDYVQDDDYHPRNDLSPDYESDSESSRSGASE